MKIPSNKIKDIRSYIHSQLTDHYDANEIKAFVELLFETYAQINKTDIYLYPEKTVSESVLLKINFAVKDLLKYKPIQYILGFTHFLDYKIFVNEHVLIPRRETEELALLSINYLNTYGKAINVLDACTGSGVLAIALKNKCNNCVVSAFDISLDALNIAVRNASFNQSSIHFFQEDMLFFKNTSKNTQWDLIVSNPPYVRQSEKMLMNANVLNYEPHIALFVEDNEPLLFYEALATLGCKNLTQNGALFCEINEALGTETKDLFVKKGFAEVEIIKDLNGKDRFIKAFL